MITRNWLQIAIKINYGYQDLLIGILALIGFTGFIQEDAFLKCIIPENKWNKALKNKLGILLSKFKTEFQSLDLSYSVSVIHEQNWNKKWEKQTGIVNATPNIIIKPSWNKLPLRDSQKLILHIDPKMSFGTGHHETTRLSLILLERFIEPEMEVLDFGTGTGVLGIACVKLGAKLVFAIDNDEWAIENAKENIKRNGVDKIMKVKLGSVSSIPRRNYDLIIANIDFRTISRFISSITLRVRKKGIIIYSGILKSDLNILSKLFSNNALVPLEFVDENEWAAVALRRM